MKKIIIFLIVLSNCSLIFAQGVLNVTSNAYFKLNNGVQIVLNKLDLINNGAIHQVSNNGAITFTGNTNNNISGSGISNFDKIILAKTPINTLLLQADISVNSEFTFNNGLLNLGNNILNLGSNGLLVNENELSRAFTTGIGYIQSSASLNSPVSVNPGNLGAIISASVNLGSTIIKRGHKVQNNVNGSIGSIQRFYDILPSNNSNLNSTLRFKYFDTELNAIIEDSLRLWESSDNSVWTSSGSCTLDINNNYLEKSGINSFYRSTLSKKPSPPPCQMSVSLGNNHYILYGALGYTGCTNLTPSITGGVAPFTYSWTSSDGIFNGFTTQSINPCVTNEVVRNYTVSVTDANSCTATATVILTFINISCSNNLNNIKVLVCHRPPGNPNNCRTICVSINSYQTLLNNGSYLGSCLPLCAIPPMARSANSSISQYIVKDELFNVKVMNNPSETFFSLYISCGNFYNKISIRIMDITGRLIEQKDYITAGQEIKLGDKFKPGIYLAKITKGENRKTVKLIKQ